MADKEKEQKQQKQQKDTKEKNPTGKERAVNPMAMRPEGVNVTFQTTKEEIEKMKKKFGF
jgi:hypothetical protein